jgi:hypothetical protein
MTGENRLNMSTTVRTRIFWPIANWSWMKSTAKISLDAEAARRSSRSVAFTLLFGVSLRSCRPKLV